MYCMYCSNVCVCVYVCVHVVHTMEGFCFTKAQQLNFELVSFIYIIVFRPISYCAIICALSQSRNINFCVNRKIILRHCGSQPRISMQRPCNVSLHTKRICGRQTVLVSIVFSTGRRSRQEGHRDSLCSSRSSKTSSSNNEPRNMAGNDREINAVQFLLSVHDTCYCLTKSASCCSTNLERDSNSFSQALYCAAVSSLLTTGLVVKSVLGGRNPKLTLPFASGGN